uniref:Transposase n=1 Tax=Knipowitschia caucasica TaxID=637954 RepID=A0AAV2LEZ1_KNICA
MRLKPPYGEKEAAWLCRDICHGGKSISRSIRCGSIFQGSHVKLSIWMHFIFRFAQGLHLRQIDMLQEGITGSSASLTKLAHVLRKVCKAAVQRMRRRGKQIVGRRGEIVLIDESKFGHKRKYNRGRTSSRNSWLLIN